MLGTSILVLYPFVTMIAYSLTSNRELATNPSIIPQAVTFDNYVNMWSVAPFGRFFANSLLVASVTTGSVILLGAPAAYVLVRRAFRGRHAIRSFLFYTQLLPIAALLVPVFVLARLFGLYNTLTGLIIVYVGLFLPVAVLLMQGFFAQVPQEYEEAARVDGATNAQAYRHIFLPLSLPGLIAIGSIVFILCWEEYLLALVLTTGSEIRTFPIGLSFFFDAFQSDYAGLMAASVVSTVPVVVAILVSGRLITRGITQGGMKG
jgi:ABC-type glycerol-3-phosphate transport system permease component